MQLILIIHVKYPFEDVSYQTSRTEVRQLKYRLQFDGTNFSKGFAH